ncbi:hypothetical protein [Mucilaginibacter glaciei]|uniref:Uncharacterized protein n=1 Tax=Mucilaginibacter glaciei TaxID=2772109 RepID=A0A926NU62_9SPHI|nr:hypothetical protein [Mucilaginibacter glaciei]MBD1395343.1 hypothetical protein [Mucilaginibacter glaciei]
MNQNNGIMEMGYNTLDLAMLGIAAVVIYAASRVPVQKPAQQKRAYRLTPKQKHKTSHSV